MSRGILHFVPTMMADEKVIRRVAKLLKKAPCHDRVPCIYVEGPFINNDKRGGVQKEYIHPVRLALLKKLQKIADNRIGMMTFAPELKNAEKLPAAMQTLGILPCVGHSAASAERTASVCGSRKVCCTHLFNAMSGLDHHAPGIAAFGLNSDRVFCELNADGVHVAPQMLKLAYRAGRADRIVLISDAVISADSKPGTFEYMNMRVTNSGNGVYYTENGTLVGSSILLNKGVANFMKHTGAAIHEAVGMASLNPAIMLGMGKRTGSLEAGKSADVVIFQRNFSKARNVFYRGQKMLPARQG